jgi:hypothetical protein
VSLSGGQLSAGFALQHESTGRETANDAKPIICPIFRVGEQYSPIDSEYSAENQVLIAPIWVGVRPEQL